MPMIKSRKAIKEKDCIKARVNSAVLEQIEAYCQWAGIYDVGYFIEKAAHEVFLNDIEWLNSQKRAEEVIV